MLPFAAMVAGESRLGVFAGDLFGFKATTEGLMLSSFTHKIN